MEIVDQIKAVAEWSVAYHKTDIETGELEICLIPKGSFVQTIKTSDSKTELYTVPSGQKIIKLNAGDPWPFGVFPGAFWKADHVQNFIMTTKQIEQTKNQPEIEGEYLQTINEYIDRGQDDKALL